jgi:chemotaxis protein MotA
MIPVRALATVADALPGLGIVAAVLGVVITMGALSGPPEEIGQKVGAALVGTFLGILLSYGVVAPTAANIEKIIDASTQFHQVLRAGLMAFAKGMAPSIAVEFARRAIPHEVRPTFKEMEAVCRHGVAAVPAADAAKAA